MIHPNGTELLDDPAADPIAVRRSLRNIARSNTLFGGTAAALFGIDRLLAATPNTQHATLSLLDLGTGAGDIPRAIRAWGRGRGIAVTTVGLERLRPAAHLAQDEDLPVVLGCISALPIRPASVDIVLMSQVLHHLDAATAVDLLRSAMHAARLGIVVADLIRSATAATLFRVASHALGFDHYTREDGVTSVRRGFSTDDLSSLFVAAGLRAEVTTRPGWRLVAWAGHS